MAKKYASVRESRKKLQNSILRVLLRQFTRSHEIRDQGSDPNVDELTMHLFQQRQQDKQQVALQQVLLVSLSLSHRVMQEANATFDML